MEGVSREHLYEKSLSLTLDCFGGTSVPFFMRNISPQTLRITGLTAGTLIAILCTY